MTLSLEGFREFASHVVLDTGGRMELRDYQAAMVADFVDPALTEVWCVMPEGQAKSTLMGVYCLYVLMCKPGANVVIASVTQQQASSAMFKQAADIIDRSPGLGKHLRVLGGYLRIMGPRRSRLEVKPSDPRTAQGTIPDLVVIDELGEQAGLGLAATLRGKITKRLGSKLVVVSSAGEPGSDFERVLDEIRSTADSARREGRRSRYQRGPIVLHEHRLEADDPLDPDVLALANPLTSREQLAQKIASPLTSRAHIERYVAGRPQRTGEHCVAPSTWDAARLADGVEIGSVTYTTVGLDFAMSWDSLAVVRCREFDSGAVLLLDGVQVCEPPRLGEPIPLATQCELAAQAVAGGVDAVVLNPAAGSADLERFISDELGLQVFLYGTNQTEAVELAQVFVAAVNSGRLKHDGDQVLRDHVLNAVPHYTGDGQRFRFGRPDPGRTARRQGGRRIDAASAAQLAVWFVMAGPRPLTAAQMFPSAPDRRGAPRPKRDPWDVPTVQYW